MAYGNPLTNDDTDEEHPSSLPVPGEVLFCANANGVITYLKLVGEPRTEALWRKYSFPPQVRVAFPFFGVLLHGI